MILRRHIAILSEYFVSALGFVWRRLMFRTTFIAITGSAGKSTATACLGTILAAHAPTNWQPGGRNSRPMRTVLKTRFRHRFCVLETGSNVPGTLRRTARMIAPDIAVVLRVLHIHSNAFPTIDDVVREKSQLLTRLGRRGTAILNADDPLVMGMAQGCQAQIRTFGLAPGAFVTADQVSAVWPERLSFRARYGDETARVETNLAGEQWVGAVLSAIAAAVSCGVPLSTCAAAIKTVQPVLGRMYPIELPNGAWVIRDDFNGNLPSLISALDFLGQARVTRRIVVVGDVLDTGLTVRPRARQLGTRIAKTADMAVFLGRDGRLAVKAAGEAGMESVHAFEDLRAAAAFLKSELRPGDLMLSAGWQGRHIERVTLAQLGQVGCWLERCRIIRPCEMCSQLKLVPFARNAVLPSRGET